MRLTTLLLMALFMWALAGKTLQTKHGQTSATAQVGTLEEFGFGGEGDDTIIWGPGPEITL